MYVSGSLQATASVSGSLYNENAYTGIGGLYENVVGWIWEGGIDEVRICKEALYTGGFAPPTAPFPNS